MFHKVTILKRKTVTEPVLETMKVLVESIPTQLRMFYPN